MSRSSWFSERRRQEHFAFLVVRFLRAFNLFDGIYNEFKNLEERDESFEGSGLFARIRDLEEQIVFDIKEKAHTLFRQDREPRAAGGPSATGREGAPSFADLERALLSTGTGGSLHEEARGMFAALRKSLVDRSLDAYIGTGFHMFMILRESLYQLESYSPKYALEMEQVRRVEYLTHRIGYDLDEEEEHELNHIRQVAALCQGIAADTRGLASVALNRCRSLFRETAEVMRHSIEEAGENAVLVLNLLQQRELVDAVYGPGASEEILDHMFRGVDRPGASGWEKAVAYAVGHCGNVDTLTEILTAEPG